MTLQPLERGQSLRGADDEADPPGLERHVRLPQAQIKACMNMLGQHGGHVRPPLLPIDDPGQLEMLRQILDEAGLFTNETGRHWCLNRPRGLGAPLQTQDR